MSDTKPRTISEIVDWQFKNGYLKYPPVPERILRRYRNDAKNGPDLEKPKSQAD